MADRQPDRANGSIRTYAGQGYAVPYLARKHGLTKQQARDLIRKVGHDRAKLNEAAMRLKG